MPSGPERLTDLSHPAVGALVGTGLAVAGNIAGQLAVDAVVPYLAVGMGTGVAVLGARKLYERITRPASPQPSPPVLEEPATEPRRVRSPRPENTELDALKKEIAALQADARLSGAQLKQAEKLSQELKKSNGLTERQLRMAKLKVGRLKEALNLTQEALSFAVGRGEPARKRPRRER